MQKSGPGIVLLAHGSRDARWRAPVEAVARRITDLNPSVEVRCAYLELSQPGLQTAVAELVAGGAAAVRVMPLFLGMGKHLREDLPRLLEELRVLHPRVPVELTPSVGEQPKVLDLLAQLALGS